MNRVREQGGLRTVRIGTRASRLALGQAQRVAELLRRRFRDLEVELVPITTAGDRASERWERQLRQSMAREEGARAAAVLLGADPEREAVAGAFVKEIEQALLDGRCDLAVHSLKDVPSRLPEGLVLAAFPEREDPRDALVVRSGSPGMAGPGSARDPVRAARSAAVDGPLAALQLLAPGSRVGTASLRRLLQLKRLRPDVEATVIRGNVDTRLAKLDAGQAEALVLAGAGLVRLGLEGRISAWLDPDVMVPAPGQGVLAVECRAEDEALRRVLERVDDGQIRAQVAAERGFLEATGAGCRWPVGALAADAPGQPGKLRLLGFVALPEGEAHPARRSGAVDGWVWARGEVIIEESSQGEQSAREAGSALARRLLAALVEGRDL